MAYNPEVGLRNIANAQINPATEDTLAARLDVALSTRLKAADTLARLTTLDTITNPVKVLWGDTPNFDAFTRLRTSNPQTVLDVQNQYNSESLRMEAGNTSDGVLPAWSANTRLVTLQINPGATGGSSFLQSFQYIPYQPGKSQYIIMTGVLGTGTAGAVKRYGYGDAANGVFFEQNGANGIQFNRRTSTSGSVVNNTVTQTNWNIDKLDGSGASGITLDVTKAFILVIDLQFLGMGRIRIGFDINGVIYYAHQFLNANVLTVPYMQTATLPMLIEILAAAGLAGAATCSFKCGTVISEGGFETELGRPFSMAVSGVAAGAGRTHALSLRPSLTFNGLTTRGIFVLDNIEVLSGTNPVIVELVIGAAFSVNPTFAAVNGTYSFMDAGTGGTFSNLTTGVVANTFFVPTGSGSARSSGSKDLVVSFPITLDRSGAVRALGTISVLLTSTTGSSTCNLALNWREIR